MTRPRTILRWSTSWRAGQGPALALGLGLAHLVVDASSNFVMMLVMRPVRLVDVMGLLLAYNFAAFALQPLAGLLTDRLHRPRTVMCVGLLVAAAAMLFLGERAWVPIALTGLGNALFHDGAGTMASVATPGRASGPGLFIAPGAVGVALGTVAGQNIPAAWWPIFGVLVCFAVLGAALPYPENVQAASTEAGPAKANAPTVLLLLLLAIAIRSLLGARVVSHLFFHAGWALPLAIAAFTGKALGGLAADWAGWKRTAVVSLLLSAGLLALADQSAWVAVPALLFFQTVTSITLSAVYQTLPGRISLGFGLASLALFIGSLPILLHLNLSMGRGVPLDSLLALASVAAVWRALSLLERASRPAGVASWKHP